MSTTNTPLSAPPVRTPFPDARAWQQNGSPSWGWIKWFQELVQAINSVAVTAVTFKTNGMLNPNQTAFDLRAGTGISLSVSGENITITGLDGGTWKTTYQTGAYNALPGDMVLADTTGGGFTVHFPLASMSKNASIRVKKISGDANNITVAAVDHIDGASTQVWNSQYTDLEAISDGTTWWIA